MLLENIGADFDDSTKEVVLVFFTYDSSICFRKKTKEFGAELKGRHFIEKQMDIL